MIKCNRFSKVMIIPNALQAACPLVVYSFGLSVVGFFEDRNMASLFGDAKMPDPGMQSSWKFKGTQPHPMPRFPPGNKALRRPYLGGMVVVNNSLSKALLFLGGKRGIGGV